MDEKSIARLEGRDFLRTRVAEDLKSGRDGGRVVTRFPPEPNGFLHIGHAKSICLNFGVAKEFGGLCNLRFDDTNPEKEETRYIESIKDDVRWLGFDWEDRLYYASDYFDRLYAFAEELIKKARAYVDSLSAEEIRAYRGTLTEPGKESPFRGRCVEENLDLFRRMRDGEFPDGAHVLRAKIDMASPNISLRDPTLYRIRKVPHHRTGDKWCVYPLYDFTHCLCDALEGITHSLCTLEFENNRPLYDWVLDNADAPCHPRQIEFARLNLSHTVLSKRRLLELVETGAVRGWDDPRMPTIAGLRRRGYTPEAVRRFCDVVGVAKFNSTNETALLEHCLREDLNRRAPRAMAVLNPLKVVIENYPEGLTEEMQAVNNPEDPSAGTRSVPFCREVFIEREDFREVPPPKFFRLAPGREVRLRYAYFITCEKVIKDKESGEVIELRCRYDSATRGGDSPDGRKVKATLHWVPASLSVAGEARLYEHLFVKADPCDTGAGGDFKDHLNPESLRVVRGCRLEPSLAKAAPGAIYQFERLGYFCADPDSSPGAPVFNRTATLRDTWAKIQKKQ